VNESSSASSFDDLVVEALDSIPEAIARYLDNVEVVVEDEPPEELLSEMPDGEILLGYYHGIPLTERGYYDGALPDKVSIYRGPITRTYRSPDAIRDEVRRTVIHELAHHFGIDDDRLDELGWS
jgi:predicted Zn-dependent protease with MMP-like domain